MFAGHYAACFFARGLEQKVPLGPLFIAAQVVDIAFFCFVLVGIEQVRIEPGFTQSTHFELVYMPYTHGLAATVLWSMLAYAAATRLMGWNRRWAMALALTVASHWFLDLLVHTPDLPLLGNDSPKVGLGLWNYVWLTWALESALLVGAAIFCLRRDSSMTVAARRCLLCGMILLLFINSINLFAPPVGDSVLVLSLSALGSYALFAAVYFYFDRLNCRS